MTLQNSINSAARKSGDTMSDYPGNHPSNPSGSNTIHPSQHTIPFCRLVWEDIRHNQILVVLSILGSFLASPVYYVYMMSVNMKYIGVTTDSASPQAVFAENQARAVLTYMTRCLWGHQFCHTLVLMVGAILVAFVGFRHLFHRRMTDLYHSMPVSRNRLFLAQYLAGFLIWFVPFLAGDLMVLIGGCVRCAGTAIPSLAGEYAASWLKLTVLLVFAFLILYHLALLTVMISGNVFNAIANLLLLGLFAAGIYLVQVMYLSSFMDTYLEVRDLKLYSVLAGLSPLLTPMAFCLDYIEAADWHWSLLLSSSALCLINFCLAMVLHSRRRSEAAEGGMDSPVLRIIFRFVISTVCGLLTALLFGYLVEHNGGQQAPWLLFGGILGCAVAFCVMNVVYHADFKAVFAHKRQLLFTALVVCGIALSFRYDVFGYDTYVPDESSITGICITVTDRGYSDSSFGIRLDEKGTLSYLYDETDILKAGLMSTDSALIHKALTACADNQVIRRRSQSRDLVDRIMTLRYDAEYAYALPSHNALAYNIEVRVDTRHGSYYRSYSGLGMEAMEALAPILFSEDYMKICYPASAGHFPAPDLISLCDLDQRSLTLTEEPFIRELYAAYAKDFQTQYPLGDPFYSRYCDGLYYIGFIYNTNPDPNRQYMVNLRVWDSFQETISLLQKWYPEYTWTEADIPVSQLDISLTLPQDRSLEEYLWFTSNTSATDGAASPNAYELQTYDDDWGQKKQYTLTLTDPAELAALRPYLRFSLGGVFYDENHVYIGHALYQTANGEERLRCYAELGKLPAELLDKLKVQ